jgi:hypothetical protein
LFLTEILQVGSSFVQFYYLLTVRIDFVGKDLKSTPAKRTQLETRKQKGSILKKCFWCLKAHVSKDKREFSNDPVPASDTGMA